MKHLKGIRFGMPFIKRIGVLKDRQAHRIRWNVHDGLEVHYVLKGMCAWEIDGRSDPISVPGGAFVAFPPNVGHRAIGENAAPSTRLGIIYDKASLLPAAGVSFRQSDLKRLLQALKESAFVVHSIPTVLLFVLKELRDAVDSFNVADNGLRLRILNELLLVETVRALEKGSTFLPSNGSVVQQVCEWIKSHLDSCFSIDDLVKLSGYGRSRFFSLFFAETGMSPNDYVVRQRIERAQTLIRENKSNLLDIALACGFKSAATFSSTFRKFTGVSPRTFRKDERHSTCGRD